MKHFFMLLTLFVLALSTIAHNQVPHSIPDQEPESVFKGKMLEKTNPILRSTVAASLPKTMSYQGLLSTSMGTPVANGSYDLQFDLYDSSTNGTSQWTEMHNGVAVQHGTFSVVLGSTSSLIVDFNKKLYVEAKAFNGPTGGPTYPLTFSPRSELTSAPSSLAPWVTNGNDVYYNNGSVGIGHTAPESSGIGALKLEIADEDGNNSDVALRVASLGGSLGYPVLNFAKSGGTLASPLVTPPNDRLGAVEFLGHDGNGFTEGAAVYAYDEGTPSAGNLPTALRFRTRRASASGTQVSMEINPNGDVGIGTLSPLGKLHVTGTSPVRILGEVSTLSGAEYVDFIGRNSPYGSDLGGMRIQRDSLTGDANTLLLAAASGSSAAEKMRVGGNGNVGIGTTSPSQKLHVAGNICATGTIGSCSDIRYKKDIVPLSSSLKNVLSLQGVSYHWNSEEYPDRNFSKETQIGLIAQEVEKIYPEVVQTGTDGYKSVDYGRLTPVLIEAIKEQQKEIEELKALVKSLASEKKRDGDKTMGKLK